MNCKTICSDVVAQKIRSFNVQWATPSKDASGSMPIGNGDIGLNLWCEKNRDILFYISKTDSLSGNGEHLKIGRVRISLENNGLADESLFCQELDLYNGIIHFKMGNPGNQIQICVWVDANNPVVRVEIVGDKPVLATVKLESWRTEVRELKGWETPYWLMRGPDPLFTELDTLPEIKNDKLTWCYRNTVSAWKKSLEVQAMGEFANKSQDPLLGLTFGGSIQGNGFVNGGHLTLKMGQAEKKASFNLTVLTQKTPTEAEYFDCLDSLAGKIEKIDIDLARKKHARWWNTFWDRSWLFIEGDSDAQLAAKSYVLQRYMNACAGRGKYPIKFNGSIFNFDIDITAPFERNTPLTRYNYNADWRLWGGSYHWQNTRLIYWTMLNSGDFEMLKPLFEMYKGMLPLAKEQTQKYFGHHGAFFSEVVPVWGGFTPYDVRWDIKLNEAGLGVNPYSKYLWQGGLELLAMMLEYYEFTQDRAFFSDTLLPLAEGVLEFHDKHWSRDKNGKLCLYPSQALETYFEVKNPMTDVAGLHCVLGKLLKLPAGIVPNATVSKWASLHKQLPDIPHRKDKDGNVLLPAEEYDAEKAQNIETPELYSVFPFGLLGIGKTDIETALHTYNTRKVKRSGGWFQDAIFAACVGLAKQARDFVLHNCRFKHSVVWHYPDMDWPDAVKECEKRQQPDIRFDGFWGPNYDWLPDQDQPSVMMIALQKMLVQTDDKKIFLFPAWPRQWDVSFKMHVPYNTTIEVELKNGVVKQLKTDPPERIKDVLCMAPQ